MDTKIGIVGADTLGTASSVSGYARERRRMLVVEVPAAKIVATLNPGIYVVLSSD